MGQSTSRTGSNSNNNSRNSSRNNSQNNDGESSSRRNSSVPHRRYRNSSTMSSSSFGSSDNFLRNSSSLLLRPRRRAMEEEDIDSAPPTSSSSTDFYPAASQYHEWMGRSIESLILGSTSVAPMLSISATDLVMPSDNAISDEDDDSRASFRRQSSMSTLGSLDLLSRGRLGDVGVSRVRQRRQHGGTLANLYNNNGSGNLHGSVRYRRQSSSSLSGNSEAPRGQQHYMAQQQQYGPNVVLSLLTREVTGHRTGAAASHAKRLKQVGGKRLWSKLDDPAAGIVSEVTKLEHAIQRGDWMETCHIVSNLTPRLMGDPMRQQQQQPHIHDPTLASFASPHYAGGGRLGLERDAFLLGGGVGVFLRIFRQEAFCGKVMHNNDARDLNRSLVSNKLSSCWNEVLASLRELVYALPCLVENGDILEGGNFVPFLFTLLSHESCFDAAATLIEEILSLQSHAPPPPIPPDEAPIDGEYRSMTLGVPVTTFFLGNVPDLFSLWRGFSARQLAHFCRILALLVFEPEDRQLLESPAVLKSLELLQLRRDRAARAGRDATVDMNQAILLGDEQLLQRLLHLLLVMNYAPSLKRATPYHVMAHFPFITDTLVLLGLKEMDQWEDVERLDGLARELLLSNDGNNQLSDLGNVAEMLEHLAESLQNSTNSNSLEQPATQLGHIIHVINAAQQAGVVVGRRNNNNNNIHVASVPLDNNNLDSVASAAMTLTDHVMMIRSNNNSNNTAEDGAPQDDHQQQAPASPPPAASSYTSTGRLRISTPEDAANELQFNALLLAPYQVEVLFVLCTLLGGRRKIDAQRFLKQHDLIPIMNDMFHRLSFGNSAARRAADTTAAASGDGQADAAGEPQAGIHGPGCDCTPESALSVQYLRLLHNFCDRDCDNYGGRRLLLSDAERGYIFSNSIWEATSDDKPADLEPGLFSKIVAAFLQESDDSPYRFWLASCAESYLRGSSPNEQLFAAKSGLLQHLVTDICSDRLHCAGSLQTSFDLLGEVCKGNSKVLELLVSTLNEDLFRKLMSTAAANLVDSNVFLRSLLLTVERISAARRTAAAASVMEQKKKQFDPWKDHKHGPWTGRSGKDTRFYLTHSWWDASIKPATTTPEPDFRAAPYEAAHDDARTSDWFPPNNNNDTDDATIDESSSREEEELSLLDSGVGYNGWQFAPSAEASPSLMRSFDWVEDDAAFLPNTIERLAWFLITNQSKLLRDLLCVVDLRNINHENICCLNTAVVVAMFAHKRNELVFVLRELKRFMQEEDAARQRQGQDDDFCRDMGELKITLAPMTTRILGDRTNVLRNFRELLWFWSEYYTHRGRDRLSLEFSSHVRFQEWFQVVSKLTSHDDGEASLRLPRSPYKRAARIMENQRQRGV